MLLKLLLKFKQSVRFLQNINSNKSDNICVKCKFPSMSPWSPLEVPLKDSFRDHKDNENMAGEDQQDLHWPQTLTWPYIIPYQLGWAIYKFNKLFEIVWL